MMRCIINHKADANTLEYYGKHVLQIAFMCPVKSLPPLIVFGLLLWRVSTHLCSETCVISVPLQGYICRGFGPVAPQEMQVSRVSSEDITPHDAQVKMLSFIHSNCQWL